MSHDRVVNASEEGRRRERIVKPSKVEKDDERIVNRKETPKTSLLLDSRDHWQVTNNPQEHHQLRQPLLQRRENRRMCTILGL